MAHIKSMDNNPPPKPQPFVAQMPGRDLINATQVNTLLNAINAYMVFLTNARIDSEREPQKGGYADGGALLSAEQTLIALNNRMTELVADESRWSMKVQVGLEESLLSVHETQKDYLRFQKGAVALQTAPHARFHPALGKLEDGRWAAIFGDPATSQSIIGLGDCPEAALADFDEIFDGRHKAIYEQKRKEQNAVDGSGGSIPAGQPKLNELPAFGRRIKSNREGSVESGQRNEHPKVGKPKSRRKPRTDGN